MLLWAGGSVFRVPSGPDRLPQPALSHSPERGEASVIKAIPLASLSKDQITALNLAEFAEKPAIASKSPPKELIGPPASVAAPPQPETTDHGESGIKLATEVALQEPLPHFLGDELRVDEFPAVYQAVLWGDQRLLEETLQAGLDPNLATPSSDTPLCAAVNFGAEKMVTTLLFYGADPNLPGRDGQPPLALASLRRSVHVLRDLVLAGADTNAPFVPPLGDSLLASVTIRDLKYFLANDSGVTPLMACSARGDVEAAALLMSHGADPSASTDKHHRYAINFAAMQEYLFLMRVLLGRSPDEEPDLLVSVDLSQQKAWITKNGKVINSTTISSGRSGYATPTGRYVVTDKHVSHTSTLYHVEMPWFMRLNCSSIGLHSGHVTGRPASHGCIRLPWDKAKAFFGVVRVGDEVEITR